jgi:hypothetical protein
MELKTYTKRAIYLFCFTALKILFNEFLSLFRKLLQFIIQAVSLSNFAIFGSEA